MMVHMVILCRHTSLISLALQFFVSKSYHNIAEVYRADIGSTCTSARGPLNLTEVVWHNSNTNN